MGCCGVVKAIWNLRRAIIITLTPILLVPLPIIVNSKEARCAYVILLMAVYWMTEVLPMAVTALIPTVLMPALGVMSSVEICKNYFQDTIMLFFGGLMVAVAVEKWMLHKRIALRVLLLVGSKPKWLMFGFMVTTAFLSMWISNTATTAMMVPIVQAVLSELRKHSVQPAEEAGQQNGDIELNIVRVHPDHEVLQVDSDPDKPQQEPYVTNSRTEKKDDEEKAFETMCKGMVICVAYAANIGGTSTLTGTGTNVVFKGQVDTLYGSKAGITYSNWFVFAFPNMIITLFIAWIWLQVRFLGVRSLCEWRCGKLQTADQAVIAVIRQEYEKLGQWTFAEGAVLIHFIALALLWITRDPEFVPGWAVLFTDEYMTDATACMFIAILLFICPSRRPGFLCWPKGSIRDHSLPSTLLDWKSVTHGLPWSVLLVIGGGFAMADACKTSGLSHWMGEQFRGLGFLPPWFMVLLICIIIAGFTEVTSNVATLTIFLPVLAELSANVGVNPLYVIIPATIATSFAFMLPVATPPNAIVFAYGYLHIKDMVLAGVVLNFLCIGVVNIAINTWGVALYNLSTFPDWAKTGNATQIVNVTVNIPHGNVTDLR